MSNTEDDKLLYQIALTKVSGIGDITAKRLLKILDDPQTVFRTSIKELTGITGISDQVAKAIHDPNVMRQAEIELSFIRRNSIQTYFVTEDKYPRRLLNCADSPILLYFKGNTDLNATKIISIVGTRNSSSYGNSFCESFLKDLSVNHPDTLIISGLAYGIDIAAHRAALACGLATVGVLAHGLDRIYPTVHRQTATEMLSSGGLLTEFTSKTEPDKFNFVRRNRIVAGMADALLVMESNVKGGSLITAEIARSYSRPVFALPGRAVDLRSEGCNNLIAEKKAEMLISWERFESQIGWNTESPKPGHKAKQQQLFFDLSPIESQIVEYLNTKGVTHIDVLAKVIDQPPFETMSLLFEMEMRGIVKVIAGSFYEGV